MMWLWWAGGAVVALIAVLVVLSFLPTFTRDRPEHEPEPAIRAAQHRAHDASDLTYFHDLADTVPNIRLAVIAERAAKAIADIPMPEGERS